MHSKVSQQLSAQQQAGMLSMCPTVGSSSSGRPQGQTGGGLTGEQARGTHVCATSFNSCGLALLAFVAVATAAGALAAILPQSDALRREQEIELKKPMPAPKHHEKTPLLNRQPHLHPDSCRNTHCFAEAGSPGAEGVPLAAQCGCGVAAAGGPRANAVERGAAA